ncbi:hypothetical protein BACI348_50404 [Bacillus altitudinis]|uniref:Uncharacterized protein n=1 Tax=Bacillus altitudinis TaxID=293387 RepID=A0A653WMB1_BACAB|nr:hypothetical protein BACI9J_60403 [Bacillus altitudinis]VXC15184.1 hypothetical protein BACI348_50404 [Bacillus altitudinis]
MSLDVGSTPTVSIHMISKEINEVKVLSYQGFWLFSIVDDLITYNSVNYRFLVTLNIES